MTLALPREISVGEVQIEEIIEVLLADPAHFDSLERVGIVCAKVAFLSSWNQRAFATGEYVPKNTPFVVL